MPRLQVASGDGNASLRRSPLRTLTRLGADVRLHGYVLKVSGSVTSLSAETSGPPGPGWGATVREQRHEGTRDTDQAGVQLLVGPWLEGRCVG